ncbi:MAG TPA: transcriptional regulator GcvA [Stellaceae bacterium]|nr:transcriptional regulator GcvA [Stellaceae bacterium]
MTRALPPLNALRAFEAAARHLSFTRAAEELHVTQAAVSHQIKGLEAFLGVPLFRRLPRRLLLTDEGQALLPELRDAFARMGQAVERIAARPRGGTLTVGTMTTIAMTWLVPRLPRFQAAHPEIDVRILTTQRLVDFAHEDIDVAIRYGEGGWAGLRAQKMFDDFLTPLCGRRFKDLLREPADLRSVPLLRTTEETEWPLWLAAAGLDGFALRRGPIFDSTKVAAEAAVDGLGIVMAQPSLFADDLAVGRLFQPFALTVPNGKSYWLVAPEATAERPKIKAFRDWIAAETAAVRQEGSG